MNITPVQHSRILGWALVGYGAYSFYGVATLLWLYEHLALDGNALVLFVPQLLSGIAMGLLAIVAGGVFNGSIDNAFREENQNLDPKFPGILFMLGAIGSFPLGTILSGYVLLYLYVISPFKPLAPEAALGDDDL